MMSWLSALCNIYELIAVCMWIGLHINCPLCYLGARDADNEALLKPRRWKGKRNDWFPLQDIWSATGSSTSLAQQAINPVNTVARETPYLTSWIIHVLALESFSVHIAQVFQQRFDAKRPNVTKMWNENIFHRRANQCCCYFRMAPKMKSKRLQPHPQYSFALYQSSLKWLVNLQTVTSCLILIHNISRLKDSMSLLPLRNVTGM